MRLGVESGLDSASVVSSGQPAMAEKVVVLAVAFQRIMDGIIEINEQSKAIERYVIRDPWDWQKA
jgi:hypothetical protein